MQGFKVTFNGQQTDVGCDDGLLTVHLFCRAGMKPRMVVSGTDYAHRKQVKWLDCELQMGDRVDLEFAELGAVSCPVSERVDSTLRRPFTKLDMLRSMERYLKSKGLL